MRGVFVMLGTLFVLIGAIGVILPVLPTTPFLLLAAACYARGSVRFYNWLMRNPLFGHYIRTWRQEGRIPMKAKILAVTMIVLSIGLSIALFIPFLAAKVATALIGLGVIVYICRFPS